MATNRRGRATRARLLDAAERIMAEQGTAITMEEVAAAAEVTRSTVYRHVEDRGELITEVVLRSTARVADRLAAALDADATFSARLTDALLLVMVEIRDTPHLRAVVTSDLAGTGWTAIDPADRFLDAVLSFFGPRFERAVTDEGVVLRAEVDDVLDWVLRQALLPLLVVGRRGIGDDALRHDLETFVVPAVIVTEPPYPGRTDDEPGARR